MACGMTSMPNPEAAELLPLSESDITRVSFHRGSYDTLTFPFNTTAESETVAKLTAERDTSIGRHFKGKETYEIELNDIPESTYRYTFHSNGADTLSKGAGGGSKWDITRR